MGQPPLPRAVAGLAALASPLPLPLPLPASHRPTRPTTTPSQHTSPRATPWTTYSCFLPSLGARPVDRQGEQSGRAVVRPGIARNDGGARPRRAGGELGGLRGGALVHGVPARAGAAPQALLRLLQQGRLRHARRHRRRTRLPLRAGLGFTRLPRRIAILAKPDAGSCSDAVVHDLRRGVLPPERRRAAGQRPAPPHQHRRPRRRPRLPEEWDGAGGLPDRHRDHRPAAAPEGDAQGSRYQGHRPQPPRRRSVRGDLLGGANGLWDVRHLPHCHGCQPYPHQDDGYELAAGERLLVPEDRQDGQAQAGEEEASAQSRRQLQVTSQPPAFGLVA